MDELFGILKRQKIIQLPIYKIDDIIVNASLFINHDWVSDETFYFEASLVNGSSYIDHGTTYEEFCKLIDGLKDMKFDILNGEFVNPNKLSESPYKLSILSMFHHPNIEMDYVECCVCFEYTKTKTPCKHSLCIRCEQNLKNKKCPLCRTMIVYRED
jgi:hypothetical protein